MPAIAVAGKASRALAIAVAGILAIAGCGGADAVPSAATRPATPKPGATPAMSDPTPTHADPARAAIGPNADTMDVSSVIGKPAPGWQLATWFNLPAGQRRLDLADLRGSVVLVRWFMSAECPYCSATAPSLVDLDQAYRSRGLTVVGMYHHKSEGPLVVADVRSLVQDHYRFGFPVAIDDDWKTLRAWWLDAHPKSWTSVSFLVDRRGVIRFMHLGGEYAPGSADLEQMRRWIERLLSEPR